MTDLEQQFRTWFFQGLKEHKKKADRSQNQDPWYKVMCLTGVDYFSSLGYQPGIAYLAAGLLSPIATLFLVFVTLFGAVPIYRRVAEQSPHGEGSIAMLERLLPGWRGKLLVLVLLGFAATDFIITITLSAADAAQHVVANPYMGSFFHDSMYVTIFLILLLGGIFLMGFREAIGVAVLLVITYLALNAVVVCAGAQYILANPDLITTWKDWVMEAHHSVGTMFLLSALMFPKLALGLSGFETGVAVMPLIQGDPGDTYEAPAGRIRKTKYLLVTAALIMSGFLLTSAVITTLIIPPDLFAAGQPANGRALAYLAHKFLGQGFGSLYDLSTIAILWFAGASALAGLLNLVPRYLPRYGMAPEWARAVRPNVVFFTVVALVVTLLFQASVDAQAGAYATGVLVLMTSGALAVTLIEWEKASWQRLAFLLVTLAFTYTTTANCLERPEGLHIASFFIAAILVASLASRVRRSTELRIKDVVLDDVARQYLDDFSGKTMRLVSPVPGHKDYDGVESRTRAIHNIPPGEIVFLEVYVLHPSEFMDDVLAVHGLKVGNHRILRCNSSSVANALAAILLKIRDTTGKLPHLYLSWAEQDPFKAALKFLFLGQGEAGPTTREVLRQAEPDPERRPWIHVT